MGAGVGAANFSRERVGRVGSGSKWVRGSIEGGIGVL